MVLFVFCFIFVLFEPLVRFHILVKFGLLSGCLLGNSCSLGVRYVFYLLILVLNFAWPIGAQLEVCICSWCLVNVVCLPMDMRLPGSSIWYLWVLVFIQKGHNMLLRN